MAGFSPSTYALVMATLGSGGGGGGGGESAGESFVFKGSVPTKADLPSTHNKGDMWLVESPACKAIWDGGGWVYLDETPSNISQLFNDEWYLSSKQSNGKYIDNIYIDGSGTMPAGTTNLHKYLIKDIQFKRGTSAADLANTTPKIGEPVFEYVAATKTFRLKIGNGTSRYSELPYIGSDFLPSADNKSVSATTSTLQIFGFGTASAGFMPRKSTTGLLEWVKLADVIDIIAGKATAVTKTSTVNGNVSFKVDTLYDNTTVKVDANNRLTIPIDNDTIKLSNGKMVARKPIAGTGISVTEKNGDTVVATKLKAGANVTLATGTDGTITIGATGGSSTGGDTIAEGKGIKITPNASTGVKTISGNYVAGQNIIMTDRGANQVEISVNPAAVNNTVRPIEVNGTEILNKTSLTTPLNLTSKNNAPYGIRTAATGNKVSMEIANPYVVEVNDRGLLSVVGSNSIKEYTITLTCNGVAGGANPGF